MLKPYINEVINSRDLSADEAEEAMNIIMNGEATPAQIGGYLVALRMKGETVPEITGSAIAMRKHAEKVDPNLNGAPLLDTAGTGGDGKHTFNISTAAAFLIAGAGIKVAKHGNRAASSQCGSADVLSALGINIDLSPDQVRECIREIGIGFLFAPRFHPAMKNAIGPRRELGQRTVFNLLGPLTNPAGATHQIIGVYDPELNLKMAQVLANLGVTAAYVVHGYGGLDELSTNGPNQVCALVDGKVSSFTLDPQDYDLNPINDEELTGGDPMMNAKILFELLRGNDRGPRRDMVILNAGAALGLISGDLQIGINLAQESLDSNAAFNKLQDLITATRIM